MFLSTAQLRIAELSSTQMFNCHSWQKTGANSMRVSALMSLLPVLLFISGCQTTTAEGAPEVSGLTAQAGNAAMNVEFADNTDTYVTRNEEEDELIELLLQNIKSGYETLNLQRILNIVTNDFERRFIVSERNVLIENKLEYIDARKRWEKRSEPVRELLYSIRGIEIDKAGNNAVVIALSTYQDKYFSPRFLESLRFTKTDQKWMLQRHIFVPLTLSQPEMNDVQIFVAREAWARDPESNWSMFTGRGGRQGTFPPTLPDAANNLPLRELFPELVITEGADALVELHQQSSVNSIPYNKGISILFVFREPPPIGAKIVTELVYERSYGKFPFRFEYEVEKIEPFFVIENLTRSDDRGGKFIMRVFIDGKMIAEKKIRA